MYIEILMFDGYNDLLKYFFLFYSRFNWHSWIQNIKEENKKQENMVTSAVLGAAVGTGKKTFFS